MKVLRLSGIVLRILSIMCILTALYGASNQVYADAQDTTRPKLINIVYDDSGSMCANGNLSWCRAKYAMEVFTVMMGEKDVINIYPMSEYVDLNSNPNILTIKGTDNPAKRREQVHNMNANYGTTPSESVESAIANLSSASDNYDKWLVVLTDGEQFYVNGSAGPTGNALINYLEGQLGDFAKKGSNCYSAYLAIGDKAVSIFENTSIDDKALAERIHSLVARDSNDILNGVTTIAKAIFEHKELPASHISGSGNMKLNIDIPTSQIIVFAQGANVSIGDMKLNGKDLSGKDIKSSSVDVKYSDVLPVNYEDARVDENLKGVLATYEAMDSGNPFSAGEFEVSVSGADKIEIYYKAASKIACQLIDKDGNVVNPDVNESEIVEGDYYVKVTFVDPLTGEELDSDLLKVESNKITIDNNGSVTENDNPFSDPISFKEGNLDIDVEGYITGNLHITEDFHFKIVKKPIKLRIDVQYPDENYRAQDLNENCAPIIATLINESENAVITQEQWDNCSFDVKRDKNDKDKSVDWEFKKGTAVGTFEIRPIGKKNATEITPGAHYFVINAELKKTKEKKNPEAEYDGSIQIDEYTGTKLIIEPENPEKPVRIPRLGEFEGITVRVYVMDDNGSGKQVISEELWKELDVKCVAPRQKRVSWSIEPGTEVGTYKLKPKPPIWGQDIFMYGSIRDREHLAESFEVPIPEDEKPFWFKWFVKKDTVTVDGYSEIYTHIKAEKKTDVLSYVTETPAEARMKVSRLMWWEILDRIWKLLVAIAVFLFFWFGYTRKPRINRKLLKPHIVYDGNSVRCNYKIKKVLVPYAAETAEIMCFNPAMECPIANLKIRAARESKFGFRIINVEQVLNPAIRIKGVTYSSKDVEKILQWPFAYNGFMMSPVPEPEQKVGMFYMSKPK